jgi:hypothetical protein
MGEIKAGKPTVIIALGGSATASLLGYRWKHDTDLSVGRWRGLRIPDRDLGAWICPTFHPSYVEREEKRNPAVWAIWERDLARALELVGKPLPGDPEPEVKILTSPRLVVRELKRMIPKKTLALSEDSSMPPYIGLKPGTRKWWNCWVEHPELQPDMIRYRESGGLGGARVRSARLAIDFETTGLKPYMAHHRIVSCSLSLSPHEAVAWMWRDMDTESLDLFSELMQSPYLDKIAGNIKFEQVWTRQFLDYEIAPWWWDTVIAAKTLDNRPGNSSVKFQVYSLLGVIDYDSHIRPFLQATDSNALNNIHKVPEKDLLHYNGLDAAYEFGICLKQREVMGL